MSKHKRKESKRGREGREGGARESDAFSTVNFKHILGNCFIKAFSLSLSLLTSLPLSSFFFCSVSFGFSVPNE